MDESVLYHITCKAYPIGKIPPIVGDSYYHLSTQADKRAWINEFLDAIRPNGKPSRKKSFFACDSIMNCKALKSTVAPPHCTPRIYKVKMINASKSPMALVNHLLLLGKDNQCCKDVAIEYWKPTLNWKFYEYLSEDMEIMEEVKNDNLTLTGQKLFWIISNNPLIDDKSLANQIFMK